MDSKLITGTFWLVVTLSPAPLTHLSAFQDWHSPVLSSTQRLAVTLLSLLSSPKSNQKNLPPPALRAASPARFLSSVTQVRSHGMLYTRGCLLGRSDAGVTTQSVGHLPCIVALDLILGTNCVPQAHQHIGCGPKPTK